jgi:hypothetical protein
MKIALLFAALVLAALTGACTSSPTAPQRDYPVRMDQAPDTTNVEGGGGHGVGSGG